MSGARDGAAFTVSRGERYAAHIRMIRRRQGAMERLGPNRRVFSYIGIVSRLLNDIEALV
jgi:hypothetical protein